MDGVIVARAKLEGMDEKAMREEYLKRISLGRMGDRGGRSTHVYVPMLACWTKCYRTGNSAWMVTISNRDLKRVPAMSRDAVIVSVARTPHRPRPTRVPFNATPAPTLAAHAIRAAVARAGVEPQEIEDCIVGSALPQGLQAYDRADRRLGRGIAITVAGQTVDRQCSSGLMSISMASKQVVMDRMDEGGGGWDGFQSRWCRRLNSVSVPTRSSSPLHRGHLHADDRYR